MVEASRREHDARRTAGGPGSDVDDSIRRLLAGALVPAEAPTEDDWHALWAAERLSRPTALATAIEGGALADRAAWVFLAGYQAALQRCFPAPDLDGWSAYAISEDRDGALPGVTATPDAQGVRLSGHKTWVAACDHVARLIVTVGGGAERQFFLVGREAPGVTIEARDAPSFLGELTQGRVGFEDVLVTADRILRGGSTAREFAVAEPFHVLAALNASILSYAQRLETSAALTGRALSTLLSLQALVPHELTSSVVTLALVGVEAETRATAAAFEAHIEERDPALFARWTRDRRLLGMFERGIGQRAEALGSSSLA